MKHVIDQWHQVIQEKNDELLQNILSEDVVFYSPVVHTPQRGKFITFMYLSAASKVIGGDKFKYTLEVVNENSAVLEFETYIDEISINGVDIIQWNNEGKITDFKVMVRPLKAVHKLHEMMGKMLVQLQASK